MNVENEFFKVVKLRRCYEFNTDLQWLHSTANYANQSAECDVIASQTQKQC